MRPMPDVRYQHFTFPFAIFYDELQKLAAEPPSLTLDPTEKERRDRLLAWLQENAQSGATLLDLPNWLWGRQWNALIAAVIENGIGTVFCRDATSLAASLGKTRALELHGHGRREGVVVAATGRSLNAVPR